MKTLALAAAGAAAALALAGNAFAGVTYYVSPAGSDTAAGDATHPWRTVGHVNNAPLQAGDTVLFQGGATYSDQTLMPPASGVTFGAYGTGRPNLSQGIWFSQKANLTFDGLAVDGGSSPGDLSAIQGSASGTGSTNITIRDSAFTRVRIGVNSANAGDANWTISNTLIQYTRDSGAIVLGRDFTFRNNTILDTGQDSTIAYGKHGVYAKGPGQVFVGNTIRRFSANGISLRFRNAVVEGNTISDGAIGVAWFQIDPSAGTSVIAYNRISGTTSAGIYVSPSDAAGATRESFVIASNTIRGSGGNGADISATSGNLTLANNIFTGAISPALRVFTPGGAFSEHHDAFWSTSSATQLALGSSWLTLAAYRTSSGQGAGDVAVDPGLASDLTPLASSPAVDGGSTRVGGVSYSSGCDGASFHYCGGAPDLGAVESGGLPLPPPTPPLPVAPLAPPTALAATSTGTSVSLAWVAAADPRVVGYSVTRDNGAATTVNATSLVVSGLSCGSASTYAVRSLGPDGTVSAAATLAATTQPCATPPPPPPAVKDTTPPWVLITSPTKGQTVPLSTVEQVDATDASGIADVTFWVDGTITCVDRSAPYTCALSLKAAKHTLLVRATDNAGNVGWMSVAVTASSKVAAARIAPAAGASVGSRFTLAYRSLAARAVTFAVDDRVVCVDRTAPYRCVASARPGWHRARVRIAGGGTYLTRFRVR